MRVFVTVGSGCFDQLIEAVDQQLSCQKYDVLCQIGTGQVSPRHHPFYTFKDDFKTDWQEADLVITHAGVGTVFPLLEVGKKLVVVPNMFRLDGHQDELAQYIETEQYAEVCTDLECLSECVERCIETDYNPYRKHPFFKAKDILAYLSGEG